MTNSITIVEPAHPLAAGLLAGDVQVYPGNGRLAYGRLIAPATVVATVPGHPDTAVDLADFIALRKLFLANNPGVAAVPEPATWLLAILGLMGLARFDVRRRRSHACTR